MPDAANMRTTEIEKPTISDYSNLKNQLVQTFNDETNDVIQQHLKIDLIRTASDFDLGNGSNSHQLKAFYNQMQQTNIGFIANISKAYSKLNGCNNIEENKRLILTAAQLSAAITPDNIYEENSKQIESIKTKYLLSMQSDMDAFELAELFGIASQCPYVGGPAVFDARALYVKYYPNIVFDDHLICKTGTMHKDASTEITNASVLAYPNPTDNILKLNTQLTSYSQASIYLYDVTGRLVYQKQINTQQNTEELLLGQLDNGYYNYNIIADGVSILNGKVGVIK